MITLNPKTVVKDTTSLFALLDAIGDPAKFRDALTQLEKVAQEANDAVNALQEAQKRLDAKLEQQAEQLDQITRQGKDLEDRGRGLDAREVTLRKNEEAYLIKVRRLRDIVA